jgi:uncharacterized protein YidB (DUF937 family)
LDPEVAIMGLFDTITKEVPGKLSGGGGQNPLLDMALSIITNPNTGGLQGLVENFKNKGLEGIISSWISTGQNQPISKDQILNVVGKDRIQKIAEKVGVSPEEATGGLANLLPEIIDKLTPNGKPESGLLDEALKMLKGKV